MRIYFPTILVIIIDQASKLWVKNNIPQWETWNILGSFLRFTHVKNPGIAFGIPVGNFTMIVVILSIIATIFIAYLHWQERNNHPLIAIGLGLILGGAIGNLIDRSSIFFTQNYEGVIDFIDIGKLREIPLLSAVPISYKALLCYKSIVAQNVERVKTCVMLLSQVPEDLR